MRLWTNEPWLGKTAWAEGLPSYNMHGCDENKSGDGCSHVFAPFQRVVQSFVEGSGVGSLLIFF